MKKFLDKFFPLIPVIAILVPAMFSHSCANTTQAPSGGDKDSIPPILVKVSPPNYSTNIPLTGQEFTFTFNEYVTVKDAKGIFLSPPGIRAPMNRLKGKSVIVYFERDTLRPNTTYTIDFTNAIGDNNEGNPFPGYTYVFSTGETIDTMMVCGLVQDCNTLAPVKGAKVMLYKNHADSAIFLERPDAAAITDDWGFFSIRNIADTLYRMYAIKDEDNNNMYNSASVTVGFIDSLIRPVTVVDDSMPELQKYDMKDTLACQARKPRYEISLFQEKSARQSINSKVRLSDRTCYISFTAPGAHIDTMWIRGIADENLITQINRQRDCLEIWVNDRRIMPDTFYAYVNYLKTDTLGLLSPYTEEVKLVHPEPRAKRRTKQKEITHADTICAMALTAEGNRVEKDGFNLLFTQPIINSGFDRMICRSVNPRQQEDTLTFTVTQDSTNLLAYKIMPDVTFTTGYDYFLKIPERCFRNIDGFYNDSTEVKVTLPSDDKLSTLTLHMSSVHGKYIVDLMDENKTSTVRNEEIRSDGDIVFKYLTAGKYHIRITEDRNENSLVDTGDLLSHKQPERAKFYKSGSEDNSVLEILEMSEVEQDIDLSILFN